MTNLTHSEEVFRTIYSDVESDASRIVSEEDSKVKIINRILIDVLGWMHSDLKLESKHDNGFSDYILSINGKPACLLEAKRIGKIQIDTKKYEELRNLKISGSSLSGALSGIEQAASYAAPNGLSLAVLTDGMQWVFFKPFVIGENYKNKEAIVFPSLRAVEKNFSAFYELLSKGDFAKKTYQAVFDAVHEKRLLNSGELFSPIAENEIRIARKSELAFDLDGVFSRFFDRLADDEELILECFVESRESKIAEFSLEKMAANVLGNISVDSRDIDSELSILISSSVDVGDQYDHGQSVFIVGSTGSGKTTFLERFFKKTLIPSIRQRCLVVNVNCLDSTGGEETVTSWLTESVISILENGLYEDGVPSWDDLQGLYHHEYVKRAKGVDSHLYNNDKEQFKVKFGEKLDELVEQDRDGYLMRTLTSVVNSRKMLPVLIVDNTDEFSLTFKERVFQFFQSLRRHCKSCVVIFPVTDKTAWSFSKTDIFSIYESKSFFLPSPSPREIFRKRIDFLNGKLDQESKGASKKEYFLSRGLRISIENLNGFMQVLENIFVDHDYTSKTIGELSNYNIRKTLLLSKRVVTSSSIKIDELIQSFLVGKVSGIDFSKFMEALMKGDYELYKRDDSHEIFSVFAVDRKWAQSPLLNLRVLTLLDAIQKEEQSVEDRHIKVSSIVSYFDAMGGAEVAVDNSLLNLLESKLIEPYDVSSTLLSPDQKLSLTHKGKVHLRLASKNSVFFFQMALTTPISNEETALKISATFKSDESFYTKVKLIKKMFLDYLVSEDSKFFPNVPEKDAYDSQRGLVLELQGFSDRKLDANSDLVQTMGDHYRNGVLAKSVDAVVEWFDAKRGFGFAKVSEFDESVFFHSRELMSKGVNYAAEGDKFLCEISRGAKGLHISKIHSMEVDSNNLEVVNLKVIRLYVDRKYGFAAFDNGSRRQAYFHAHLFEGGVSSLHVGKEFRAEVVEDSNGYGFQVRRIVSKL